MAWSDISAFFDYRLRSANGETWWLAAMATIAMIALGNLIAMSLGLQSAPYQSVYVMAVAVLSNRICVRSGLLATFLAMPISNYMEGITLRPFSVPPGFYNVGFHVPAGWEIASWISMLVGVLLIAPRRERPRGGGRVFDSGRNLPFESDSPPRDGNGQDRSLHQNGHSYWDVHSTGEWAEDCEVGTQYARIFIERAKTGSPRPMVCFIIRDMIVRGRYSGVEAGFCQGLADMSRHAIMRLAELQSRGLVTDADDHPDDLGKNGRVA